jgi:hypothetical protein
MSLARVTRLRLTVRHSMMENEMNEQTRYLVPFLGDGAKPTTMLTIVYLTTDFPRGVDGTCAYCHGDPCNEDDNPDSLIAKYLDRNPWDIACPCCHGQPT